MLKKIGIQKIKFRYNFYIIKQKIFTWNKDKFVFIDLEKQILKNIKVCLVFG